MGQLRLLCSILFLIPVGLSAQVEGIPRLFEPGVQQASDNTDEQIAAQYFREGQYEKAVVLYEELFEKNPNPFNYSQYLECLFALGEIR